MRTKSGNGHGVQLEQFIEDLKTVVQDGQDLIRSSASGLKEGALTSARSTDKLVRDHPYQSIGIMFGVGVLVGLLAFGLLSRESGTEEY